MHITLQVSIGVSDEDQHDSKFISKITSLFQEHFQKVPTVEVTFDPTLQGGHMSARSGRRMYNIAARPVPGLLEAVRRAGKAFCSALGSTFQFKDSDLHITLSKYQGKNVEGK